MRLNKFGLICSLLFLMLALLARFVMPLGDEPDWSFRVEDLFNASQSIASSYYLFANWIVTFVDSAKLCTINSEPLNLWFYIPEDCSEPLMQIFRRWLILVYISLPVLFILVFRNASISLFSFLGIRFSRSEWYRRLNSISLSLTFPGFIYYSGILGLEQQFLFLALLIFLFSGFWIPLITTIFILALIDAGNALVVFWFLALYTVFGRIRHCNRALFYFFLFVFMISSYYFSYTMLKSFSIVFDLLNLSEKIDSLYATLIDGGVVDKYPLYVRPVITFMTFVFMTPSYIKIHAAYLLFAYAFSILLVKIYKSKKSTEELNFFVPLAAILSLVFLMPTHSNAKYYIFLLPFFIHSALGYFPKSVILKFFIVLDVMVIATLLLYRVVVFE